MQEEAGNSSSSSSSSSNNSSTMTAGKVGTPNYLLMEAGISLTKL